MYPIDCTCKKSAQEKRDKHPILDCDIGGQRKEIKADILVIKGIPPAIRLLVKEPEKNAPIGDLSPGDQRGEKTGAERNYESPRQPTASGIQSLWQGRRACGFQLVFGSFLFPLGLTEPKRERSICPKNDAGRDEDDDEYLSFSADSYPEDVQITDRGKPKPIN